uniref:WD repeat-containing protein 89 n=1 Tax=Ceratitis capitata TaxID=7213 RepID=W8BXJ5_CERCA
MKENSNSGGETHLPLATISDDESEEDATFLDDQNTCSPEELDKFFKLKCKIADESAVSLKKDYVLHLTANNGFTNVVAGLSSGFVHIFDTNAGLTLTRSTFTDMPKTGSNEPVSICGLRYLDESPNHLLVGDSRGFVRLFDLRTQKEQVCFEENMANAQDGAKRKAINCFDSNSNARILCMGTEQSHGNVFLLFYDIRERKPLGEYNESHENDISAVRFHDVNPDLLCSGSIYGLINIFDIKEPTEDDALMATINTESTIQKLNWHKNVYEQDLISCITHTNDFYVYQADEGDVVAKFERSHITAATKRSNEANCYVVDAHSSENGDIFLLAGTNINKGEILRTLRLNKDLTPVADFIGNKQVVRTSIFNKKNGVMVTGGESGLVTLWSAGSADLNDAPVANSSKTFKHKNKKSAKKTPY